MIANITGLSDGGFATIRDKHNLPMNVGVLIFHVSVNEAAPTNVIAYCPAFHKESVIKNLCRLQFVRNAPQMAEIASMPNPGLKDAAVENIDEEVGDDENAG